VGRNLYYFTDLENVCALYDWRELETGPEPSLLVTAPSSSLCEHCLRRA